MKSIKAIVPKPEPEGFETVTVYPAADVDARLKLAEDMAKAIREYVVSCPLASIGDMCVALAVWRNEE